MRYFIVFALVSIVLFSCHKHSRVKIPADIIQPDSLVLVLTDVHILQATMQLGYTQNDSLFTSHKAFQSIWKKHHMTEGDYEKDMKFYSYHPEILDSVYEKVLSNLEEQKAELLGHPSQKIMENK
ncbi:MAG TPA: DUF4296 domain-containing protein [Bacteroidia bacterium]|nr:DUF4296 domain-containing protein [Bacteroidia bacterium]